MPTLPARRTSVTHTAMPADPPLLPESTNASGAVTRMLEYDRFYREHPWPPPFDRTRQVAVRGDARTLPIANATAGWFSRIRLTTT